MFFVTTLAALSVLGAVDAPARLPPGPVLLLDDHLIEKSEGVQRVIQSPRRERAEPVIRGKEDGNWQPYLSVVRDSQEGKFRIWYNTPAKSGSHIGYLESQDGVRWARPHRLLDDPAKIVFGVSILDEAGRVADRSRRYKLAWWNQGMWLAHSADGLEWKADAPRPVLTGINDILCITHDPLRGRYLAVFGYPSTKADGYRGKTPNAPEGYRRCVGQSVSKDGRDWSKARRIIKPDDKDEGVTEFYSIGGMQARGGLLVGLLKVLRDDLPCDTGGPVQGIGYTVLAWSHDGETWQRDREPFLDRDHGRGTWDHAMAWGDGQLSVDDHVYLYYGGYARGHKVERTTERQIGLVRFPRDRYVARKAGASEGKLTTRPLRLEADGLTLNVDAGKGTVRVQVLGADGKPFPGFTFADCAPLAVDALSTPVTWKQPVTNLRGKTVRLEFSLRNASLYAFELAARKAP